MPDALAVPAPAFLADAGWGDAAALPLAGDASARRYVRLSRPGGSALLMEDDPAAPTLPRLRALAAHLSALGLSAPRLLAEAPGRALLEDFGPEDYARRLVRRPSEAPPLYAAAAAVSARIVTAPLPDVPAFGPAAMAEAATLFARHAPVPIDAAALGDAVGEALAALPWRPALALRDFHAENLFWLPERRGLARVGLIDFQDAVACHPAYDLVSLLTDARRDVAPDAAAAARRAFLDGSGLTAADLDAAVPALSAQRNLRILGVFERLARAGKPRYRAFAPRAAAHLRAALESPALGALRRLVAPALDGPALDGPPLDGPPLDGPAA